MVCGGAREDDPTIGYLPSGHHQKYIRLKTPGVEIPVHIFQDTMFALRDERGEKLRAAACEGSLWHLQDCLHDPNIYRVDWSPTSEADAMDAVGEYD